MKKLIFFLIFIPLSVGLFGQKPPTAPQQVGTGLSSDVGKLLWMDANGRGALSPLSTVLGQNTTWNVGGNAVSAASILGTTTNHPFSIYTNNANRLYINESGNIGISTITPQSKLDVNGFITTQGLAISNSAAAYKEIGFKTNGGWRWDNYVQGPETGSDAGSDWYLSRYNDAGGYVGNILFIKRSNGYLGINNTSPTQLLDVAGSARIRAFPSGASTDSLVTADASGNLNKRKLSDVIASVGWSLLGNSGTSSSANFIGTADAQDLVFRTNNYERVRILAGGDINVGASVTTQSLYLNNTAAAYRELGFKSSGQLRWNNYVVGLESGSNTGSDWYLSRYNDAGGYLGNSLFVKRSTGFFGINNTSPSQQLDVVGTTKTTNLQVTNGANSGYIAITDAVGNLSWTANVDDSRLSTNIAKKNGTNTFSGLNTFSDVLTTTYISGTDAAFTGAISVGNATSGLHAMNRNSSDNRYAQLSTSNTFLSPIKFNTTAELSNISTINSQASVKISNGNSQSSSIYITPSIDVTTGSYTANGDLAINPTSCEMAMTQANKRKDFKFGTNARQNVRIKNLSEIGGGSSQSFTVTNEVGIVKLYCNGGDVLDMASITMNVTLPASPQNDEEFKLICVNAPATIAFVANSGQSILDTSSFSPSVASVFTLQFLSDTANSSTGVWVIKKQ